MQAEGGFTDLGIIGEKAPLAPDHEQTSKYRTPSTAGPTLTRTSLASTTLARTSLAQGSSDNNSPSASAGRNAPLARVSAANYPNLSRGSQLGLKKTSVASGGLHRSSVIRAQQEASRRAEARESVGVTVSIEDATGDKLVTFKNDGERFSASAYTIKFIQNHQYRFSITAEDGVPLEDSTMILSFLNSSGSMIKEPIECARKDKTFSGTWTCTSKPSDKGSRALMELLLPMEDFGHAMLPLNAKVYPANKSKAAESGSSLKSIILMFGNAGGSVKLKKQQWVSN